MPSSSYLVGVLLLLTGTLASENPATITQSPPAARTPPPHIAQRATTYETTSPLPLTDYNYPYSALPYQVNPYPIGRGPQSGYNQCNATTEGPTSQCQTMVVNDLADFCIWGAPTNDSTIGDVEAATVAYCTKAGRGTRLLPPGAITAAQFMRTSGYIQITGWFDQTTIGLTPDDTGGELDPHGDDKLGNPVGGLVYSSGMPSGDNTTLIQVSSWNK
ncbi:hypothetical protein HWV62_12014 [Athelia sp. TMB]|nr:hypothetical protein HWV62_12014 [Athelia sp. TMB]